MEESFRLSYRIRAIAYDSSTAAVGAFTNGPCRGILIGKGWLNRGQPSAHDTDSLSALSSSRWEMTGSLRTPRRTGHAGAAGSATVADGDPTGSASVQDPSEIQIIRVAFAEVPIVSTGRVLL